jgi:hypothetical protein
MYAGPEATKPTRRSLPGSTMLSSEISASARRPAFAVEHQRQASTGGARHHHPATDILGETGNRALAALANADQALDVTDPRRQAQDHRRLEALRKGESGEREVVCLLRIGRFEHGHMRETTPETRILLVLRRRQADVIGDGDHQTAGDAGQGHGHQASEATFMPTCFIAQKLRDPAIAAPKATSSETFSLTDHSA